MAVVGSAYIVVNAITTGFKDDIDDILNNLNKRFSQAGASFGRSLSRSSRSGFSNVEQDAIDTYKAINELIKSGYKLQGAIGLLAPALGAAASGLAIFAFQAAAAAPSLIVLGGAVSALIQGMTAFKLAFSGIGKAVSAITKPTGGVSRMPQLLRAQADADDRLESSIRRLDKAQKALTASYEEARRELEKLRYDSEDAVLSEKRAVIELEKAREQLLRVQDLPPNTRARREAELAYQEADLNLRRARSSVEDLNTDLNKATDNGKLNRDQAIANSRTVLDAIEAEADAQKDLNKATDAKLLADKEVKDERAGKGAGAGADPFEGLNKFQIEFAKFIAGLKPEIDKLKLAVSEGLLPALEDAITLVVTRLFPTIEQKLKDTGVALGKASKDFAKSITSPTAITNIGKNMDTNNYVLSQTGLIIGNITRFISALLVAADPLIRRFTDWIETLTGGWATDAEGNITGLTDMFNRAGDIAADFGDVIGNILEGFVNIGKAIAGEGGAGDSMMGWLMDLTQGFADFTAKHLASGKLQEYFQTAWDGFREILTIIGKIVRAIFEAGGDESFEGSAKAVGSGVDAILDKMPELIKGGATFAEFVGDFLKMTAAFIESGSVQAFFGILSQAMSALTGFLQIPLVAEIFKIMALMHGVRLAFSVLGTTATLTGKYIKGSMLLSKANIAKMKSAFDSARLAGMYAMDGVKKGFDALKAVPGQMKQLAFNIKQTSIATNIASGATKAWTGVQKGLNTAMLAFKAAWAANPIGIIVLGIVALIAILVLAYKKFDWFREFVDKVFKGIKIAVEAVINWLKDNWPLILAILLGPFGLLVFGVVKYWDEIVEFVKGIPGKLAAVGSAIWSWITDKWSAMRTAIDEKILQFIIWAAQLPGKVRNVASGIWSWITDRWNDMRTAVSTRVSDFIAFVAGLPARVRNAAFGMWDGIGSAFKGMLNNIIGWWNDLSFDLSIPVNSVTKFLKIAGLGFTLNTPNIPRLAKGGVVMPSPGGSLALIGEAGRPERVEPLDPDGLSKRDKALISMMTGGTTGGGITINVNPSPGMDEVELASLVSRQLAFQLRAGSV
jgi:hypothetical protein